MATFTANIPPSSILRSKTSKDDNEPRRQTKQEFKKQKELEEGRKAGTVPAMTDVETGRDINPHIPHYISNAPWYLNPTGPTLKHQRPHPDRQIELAGIYETYKKGVSSKLATKFRKGACENCGAMTHKKKDCFERPRKIGAKFTNEDIAPDEFVPDDLTLSYDAKRDRWTGFDPTDHAKVVDEYQRLEEARKIIKTAEFLENPGASATEQEAPQPDQPPGETGGAEIESGGVSEGGAAKASPEPDAAAPEDDEYKLDADEDKYAEGADMPGVKIDVDSHTRITVRNLRIREDTAKYLYNLDPESAYYDPKSRAMREDPFKNVPADRRPQNLPFAGDNFRRYTGEVRQADGGQVFAWEAQTKGLDVHALAEPTKLEALRREYDSKKNVMKTTIQESVFDKYGGKEHVLLDDATKKLIFHAQTDTYTEYNRKGDLVKGQEKLVTRSRYNEDRYHNNHTTVYGSYWSQGRWGYKCCHSFVRNSYCLGEEGRSVNDSEPVPAQKPADQSASAAGRSSASSASGSSSSTSSSDSSDVSSCAEEEEEREKATNQKRTERKRRRRVKRRGKGKKVRKVEKKGTDDQSSSGSESESESGEGPSGDKATDRLKEALIKQAQKDKEGRLLQSMDDRRRPYNSMKEEEQLSQADLEAFKLRRLHPDDPMASYFDK